MNLSIASNTHNNNNSNIPDRINSTLNLPTRYKQQIEQQRQKQQQKQQIKTNNTNNTESAIKTSASKDKDDDNTDDIACDEEDVETIGTMADDAENQSVNMDNNNDTNATITSLSLSSSSSCSVSFNKRGNYIAVGYNTGSLCIYDFISRSVVSFCYPDGKLLQCQQHKKQNQNERQPYIGYNSISWSRHSRRILCTSINDIKIRLVDNTYPNNANTYASSSQHQQTSTTTTTEDKSNITMTKDIPCITVKNLSISQNYYSNNTNTKSLCLHVLPSSSKVTKSKKNFNNNDKQITSNPHYMEQENTYSFLNNTTTLKKKKKRARKNAPNSLTPAIMQPNKMHASELSSSSEDNNMLIQQQILQQHGYDNKTDVSQKPAIITNTNSMQTAVGGRGRGSRSSLARGGRMGRGSSGGRGRGSSSQSSLYNKQQSNLLNNKNNAKNNDNRLKVHSLITSLPINGDSSTTNTIVMSQIHPKDDYLCLCVLSNGSLVLIRFPLHTATTSEQKKTTSNDSKIRWNHCTLYYLHNNDNNNYHITYAIFDKTGTKIYASTKCSYLIGYSLPFPTTSSMIAKTTKMSSNNDSKNTVIPKITPSFIIAVTATTTKRYPIKYIQLSTNGTYLLICHKNLPTFKFYETKDFIFRNKINNNTKIKLQHDGDNDNDLSCDETNVLISPCAIFHPDGSSNNSTADSNNIEWECFDFSYNEEYIVAGCNITSSSSSSDHYELYLWHANTKNITTNNNEHNTNIIHKLSGPSNVTLTNLSWHPYRPFIAISTSDGLIDIWGPSMDWTNFAPDFTPINENVEYVEQEHEFDSIAMSKSEIIKEDNSDDSQEESDNDDNDNEKSLSLSVACSMEEEDNEDEDKVIDIVTSDKISVFLSDSEDDNDIFYFKTTKIPNMIGGGRRGTYNKL